MRILLYRITSASHLLTGFGLAFIVSTMILNALQVEAFAQNKQSCGDSAFPCRRQPAGSSFMGTDSMPDSFKEWPATAK
jgi:hypothetical protein